MKLDLKSKRGKLVLFGSIATVAVVATAIAVPVALLVPGKSSPASSSALTPEKTGLSAVALQEIAIFNKNNNDALLVAPSTGGSRVTVKENSFFNRTDLPDGFTLPSAVTDIAANAFKGAKLPNGFMIPAGVTNIDPTAFADVVFDEADYWDGSEAKAGAKVDVVENNTEWKAFIASYPGSLEGKATKANAFKDRKDLAAGFLLPSFLTKIGDSSFSGATLPDGFTLPGSILSLGVSSFSSAVLTASFRLPTGLTIIRQSAFAEVVLPIGFALPPTVISLGIPPDRSAINWSPFQRATFPAGFTLPDTLEEIADSALLETTLPLGFTIPAKTKIFTSNIINANHWSTSPDQRLALVSLPANAKWSDSRGAVSGSRVVPDTTAQP